MDKKYWQNPFILAVMLMVFGYPLNYAGLVFGLEFLRFISPAIAAMLVSILYTQKLGVIMESKLRLKTAVIWLAIITLIFIPVSLLLEFEAFLLIFTLAVIYPLFALATYFLLASGKYYLKDKKRKKK